MELETVEFLTRNQLASLFPLVSGNSIYSGHLDFIENDMLRMVAILGVSLQGLKLPPCDICRPKNSARAYVQIDIYVPMGRPCRISP